MKHVRTRPVLVVLWLTLLAGCNQPSEPVDAASETVSRTPQELLTAIEESVASAKTTHHMLQSDFQSFRVEVLRGRATDGNLAIQELLAHADVTVDDADAARCAQSSLLYLAATNCEGDFAEQLSRCAEQMLEEHPDTEACRMALARWLCFRYADQESPFDEALTTVADYAQVYPQAAETAVLFSRLANRLVKEKRFEAARQTLQVGDGILEDHQALDRAKNHFTTQLRREQRRAAKVAAEQQFRAHMKSIVGSRKRGYFVVYSEDAKTRRCNYSKCDGFDAVVNYAKDAIEKNWKWEFIARYPDTRQGSIDATNKVSILYRANTTISFGGS